MKLTSLEAITRALDEAGVPFIVVGGLAVVAHGYGRQTQDLLSGRRQAPDLGQHELDDVSCARLELDTGYVPYPSRRSSIEPEQRRLLQRSEELADVKGIAQGLVVNDPGELREHDWETPQAPPHLTRS